MTPENVPEDLVYAVMPAFLHATPDTWASMTAADRHEAVRVNGETLRRVLAATINLAANLNAGSEHTA